MFFDVRGGAVAVIIGVVSSESMCFGVVDEQDWGGRDAADAERAEVWLLDR